MFFPVSGRPPRVALASLPHHGIQSQEHLQGLCNKAPSPGWSRNLEVSIKLYPGTNEELEARGPSHAGNSWAQLSIRTASPLHAAPSFSGRRIRCTVSGAGQGRSQRAALPVGTGVGRGGKDARRPRRGGGPEPGGPQKCPRALGTAGNQGDRQTASALPANTGRNIHPQNLPSGRHGAAGHLRQRAVRGPKPLLHLKLCLLAFKSSPVLGLFV